MTILGMLVGIAVVALATFGATMLARRLFPGLAELDPGPWSSSLSYIAATYGVLIGFTIVFLLSEQAGARHAVADEATSIGTAFEEAAVFGDKGLGVQHALICYSRAVTEYEWQTLADGASAPQADHAYRDVILEMGSLENVSAETSRPAAATNMFVQAGNISTARETRLVVALFRFRSLMWGFFVGGAVLVLILLFVVSTAARPLVQGVLMGLTALATAVMLAIVLNLSTPFSGLDRLLEPTLIEQTTVLMRSEAPDAAAEPCAFEQTA